MPTHGHLENVCKMAAILFRFHTTKFLNSHLSPPHLLLLLSSSWKWSVNNNNNINNCFQGEINSLGPEICYSNFKSMILKLIIQNSSMNTCCEIDLIWMPRNCTNDKSRLVQVRAWCHQATRHYLSQCWPRSMSSYDITSELDHNELTSHVPINKTCIYGTQTWSSLCLQMA